MGLSVRADEDLLEEFCDDMEYVPVVFEAFQSIEGKRKPIYHTNVMMSVADDFAIVCLDAVDDVKQKKQFGFFFEKMMAKEIVSISEDQMKQFAGNTNTIHNKGKKIVAHVNKGL